MGFLIGYKTYITVGLAAAAYAAFLAGLITRDQLETILMGLGIPAVGFLRSAISQQPAVVLEKVEEVKHDVANVKLDIRDVKQDVRDAGTPTPGHRTRE